MLLHPCWFSQFSILDIVFMLIAAANNVIANGVRTLLAGSKKRRFDMKTTIKKCVGIFLLITTLLGFSKHKNPFS